MYVYCIEMLVYAVDMYSTGPFVHKWYNYTLYRVRSVP